MNNNITSLDDAVSEDMHSELGVDGNETANSDSDANPCPHGYHWDLELQKCVSD